MKNFLKVLGKVLSSKFLLEKAIIGSFRSGFTNVTSGRLRYSGVNGYGWTYRSYSSTANAYFLSFSASAVSPSDNDVRWVGFPLRCLARSSYNVRSGIINASSGRLGSFGISSYEWSSRSYSDATYACYLNFNTSAVYPSSYYNRWNGFPLRCLARSRYNKKQIAKALILGSLEQMVEFHLSKDA